MVQAVVSSGEEEGTLRAVPEQVFSKMTPLKGGVQIYEELEGEQVGILFAWKGALQGGGGASGGMS
eukprot:scaffold38830_cov18-Tisochrysis_lutea.AAC.1